MDRAPDSQTDRTLPIGFVVMPAFVGALVWLYAMLGSMAR